MSRYLNKLLVSKVINHLSQRNRKVSKGFKSSALHTEIEGKQRNDNYFFIFGGLDENK